jgi:hypothetical protein
MATAPAPGMAARTGSNNRTVITIATLVAILAAVVLLALFAKRRDPRYRLEQLHLQNELRRSGHRRRRKRIEKDVIAPSRLAQIPVLRYDALSERQTKSLDLEKGHADGEIWNWSFARSQRELKAMQLAISNQSMNLAEKEEVRDRKASESTLEVQECSICAEEFGHGEPVRMLPCGHAHHKNCIDPWLLGFSGTCPVW